MLLDMLFYYLAITVRCSVTICRQTITFLFLYCGWYRWWWAVLGRYGNQHLVKEQSVFYQSA